MSFDIALITMISETEHITCGQSISSATGVITSIDSQGFEFTATPMSASRESHYFPAELSPEDNKEDSLWVDSCRDGWEDKSCGKGMADNAFLEGVVPDLNSSEETALSVIIGV